MKYKSIGIICLMMLLASSNAVDISKSKKLHVKKAKKENTEAKEIAKKAQ